MFMVHGIARLACYNGEVPTFEVATARRRYACIVERGVLSRLAEYLPARTGKIFVTTNQEVWRLHGPLLEQGLAGRDYAVLFFPEGEAAKRFASVEALAEQMMAAGGDRSSAVVAFGGGIVNDMGGFLASIFMRGIPVIQIPTTLLAQVDAAVGGKTGVNLAAGKNLIGTFHQPDAVLIDPAVLETLSDREYRAGLFEVVKHGVIASEPLFRMMAERVSEVFSKCPEEVDRMVAESVRIKAEVVSADERESDLRRILNFGHTIGHALEAETGYSRFLHGEAVSFGMAAATHLAYLEGLLDTASRDEILHVNGLYGPIPPLSGIAAEALVARTLSDKKTIGGRVHFVLPDRIGHVIVRSGIAEDRVRAATNAALGA
jgi:3-dehydroquinate synthase